MAPTPLLRAVLRQRVEPLRRLTRPSRQPPTCRTISTAIDRATFLILQETHIQTRLRNGSLFSFNDECCKFVRRIPPARSLHTAARPIARPTEGKDVDTASAKNIQQSNDGGNNASTATTRAPVAKEAEKATPAPVPVPVASTVAPLPIWQRLGPLTRGAEAYARAQRRRPWVTQVATMLVIYLCADISAQQISGKDEHEYERTARSLVIGGVAAIPGHMWFVFLSRNFNYSSKVLSIAVKVAINQAFFTPVFNTYFFGSQALLSGDTLQQSWDRVCATVPVSVVNSCKIWPVVTAISFAYLPLEYRALFAGVVAVGWQTYLSFLNRQAEAAEALALMRAGAPAALGSKKADGASARALPSMAAPLKNVAETSSSERSRIAM
ncbi:hypothetical protein PG990_010557 [Apiospora arundinis]